MRKLFLVPEMHINSQVPRAFEAAKKLSAANSQNVVVLLETVLDRMKNFRVPENVKTISFDDETSVRQLAILNFMVITIRSSIVNWIGSAPDKEIESNAEVQPFMKRIFPTDLPYSSDDIHSLSEFGVKDFSDLVSLESTMVCCDLQSFGLITEDESLSILREALQNKAFVIPPIFDQVSRRLLTCLSEEELDQNIRTLAGKARTAIAERFGTKILLLAKDDSVSEDCSGASVFQSDERIVFHILNRYLNFKIKDIIAAQNTLDPIQFHNYLAFPIRMLGISREINMALNILSAEFDTGFMCAGALHLQPSSILMKILALSRKFDIQSLD
ncbi:MAG: hypothetical protein Q7S22_03980 [Candidatus Micrarchaeota archaeon]|nr:hypothetical protein [Candidatus Micrarchaeota archaeon]